MLGSLVTSTSLLLSDPSVPTATVTFINTTRYVHQNPLRSSIPPVTFISISRYVHHPQIKKARYVHHPLNGGAHISACELHKILKIK